MVFTTHELDGADDRVGRVPVINRGKIVADETQAATKARVLGKRVSFRTPVPLVPEQWDRTGSELLGHAACAILAAVLVVTAFGVTSWAVEISQLPPASAGSSRTRPSDGREREMAHAHTPCPGRMSSALRTQTPRADRSPGSPLGPDSLPLRAIPSWARGCAAE